MIFKIIPILILLGTISSCSNVLVKKDVKKSYSKETNKSFEEIERANAIERYRKLRQESWEVPRKKPINRKRQYSPKKYTKPTPSKVIIPKTPTKVLVDPDQQRIEVDQNLKFYCMEKRKDPKFSEKSTCEEFTKNVLQQCEEHYEWDDKALLKCVKDKLN